MRDGRRHGDGSEEENNGPWEEYTDAKDAVVAQEFAILKSFGRLLVVAKVCVFPSVVVLNI